MVRAKGDTFSRASLVEVGAVVVGATAVVLGFSFSSMTTVFSAAFSVFFSATAGSGLAAKRAEKS
jgi:hypothetical protein